MALAATRAIFALSITFTAVGIAGCGAATLHDLKPEALAFDANNPTWDNGIGNIVQVRCATCHADPRPSFVSANTPIAGPFNMTSEANVKIIKARMAIRIQDAASPMPPNYSSPLSESEKAVLLRYLALP